MPSLIADKVLPEDLALERLVKGGRHKFWNKVRFDNEHWLWLGPYDKNQYGLFSYSKKVYRAHRVAFFLHYGKMPSNFACHYCDVPSCVWPLHLYDGTAKENAQDKSRRHRYANQKGERNPSARITQYEADWIKELLAKNVHVKEIAEELEVSVSLVRHIKNGESWRH